MLTIQGYDVHYHGENEDNTLYIWGNIENEEIDIYINIGLWEVFLIENSNGEEIELSMTDELILFEYINSIKNEALKKLTSLAS